MTKLQSLIEDLKKANSRLQEVIQLPETEINKDATIQRFQFTFELTWKTIQEYIRNEGFDCVSPKSCFKEGARLNIIDDPEIFFEFLKSRNLISHTYNEALSHVVYKKAKEFPKEVEALLRSVSQGYPKFGLT